jgi:malate dehydrogenase
MNVPSRKTVPKISVIGAGNVGGSLAQRLAERELGDVVLVDIPQTGGMPAGKALDIQEAGPIEGYDVKLSGSTDYAATEGSQVVILTAGLARKPGMGRDELLEMNARIVKGAAGEVARRSPQAIVIVVSNPLDAMCALTWKTTGFPSHRVLGMAGALDGARMKTFIAEACGVSIKDVQAMVLGGHGDTMVPLMSCATVSGIPLKHLLPDRKIQEIVQRTRDGGAEIVKLLGTGSAYYAPSASVADMAEAILKDKKRVIPCCVYLTGQYGCKDVYTGVPVKLGAGGVEEILEIPLSPEEREQFQRSVESVRGLIESLKKQGHIA